jgi:ABC-2 type transport system permease protein
LLVSAQPHRWRLLAGKVVALAIVTAAATLVATIVNVLAAVPAAGAAGVPTSAWGAHPVSTIADAWVNTFAALLVWGVIGLVLAVLSRSAAVAISVGAGYVLVVESLVKMAAGGDTDWLLGSTLTALARGGTASLAYASAVGLALLYITIGLGLAGAVFARRDVTD